MKTKEKCAAKYQEFIPLFSHHVRFYRQRKKCIYIYPENLFDRSEKFLIVLS